LRWLLRSLLKVGPGNFSNIQSFPRIKSSTSKKEYITPLVNYSYRGIRRAGKPFGALPPFYLKEIGWYCLKNYKISKLNEKKYYKKFK
jgi:hypothetical protein